MIIFGTKGREEPRGLVAEHCPNCLTIRAFMVIEVYEVPHVYFVGVGKGSSRGTLMRCLNCEQQYAFQAHRYARVVSGDEARNCSLEELIAATNPRLAAPKAQLRCGHCGYQREQAYRFCPQCGSPSGL